MLPSQVPDYFHVDCHDAGIDKNIESPRGGITCRDTTEKIKRIFHEIAERVDESPRGGPKDRDTQDIGGQEHDHVCGRHGGKSGGDWFSGKGNVGLPLSDEEEGWKIWM